MTAYHGSMTNRRTTILADADLLDRLDRFARRTRTTKTAVIAAALEAWLAAGSYKQWTCESAVHEARSPSPHGFNRICSNDAISPNATGTGAWP